jgi:phospholipid/cholesterol/gamma-HCH transport system substrate-binding protein
MEPRAHHVLIGLFTLLVGGAALLFSLWLGKSSLDRTHASYEVVFREAVSGLSIGSPVQFNGIKVGEVSQLQLDQADPTKVLAVIRVSASTPVRQNTQARLSMAGITGIAFIQLSSAAADSPPLRSRAGRLPQIIATPSPISRLLTDGSDLLSKISELLTNANLLFSPENSENFGKLLASLEHTSSSMAGQSDHLAELAGQTLEQTNQLLASSNRLLEQNGSASLEQLQLGLASLQRSSASLEQLLVQNQAPLNQGLQSLGELQPALQELRQTLANLRSISQRLESNPAGFLLGREQATEFHP